MTREGLRPYVRPGGAADAPAEGATVEDGNVERERRFSEVLVRLLREGVLYDEDADRWATLLNRAREVEAYMLRIGLRLVVVETRGYAYVRAAEPPDDGEKPLPGLVHRSQLNYNVSLLLALLRKHLADSEAAGGEVAPLLSFREIAEMMLSFLPASTDEIKLRKRVSGALDRAVKMGFVRPSRANGDEFRVMPVIEAFVDASWLGAFAERMEEYRRYAESRGGDVGDTASDADDWDGFDADDDGDDGDDADDGVQMRGLPRDEFDADLFARRALDPEYFEKDVFDRDGFGREGSGRGGSDRNASASDRFAPAGPSGAGRGVFVFGDDADGDTDSDTDADGNGARRAGERAGEND